MKHCMNVSALCVNTCKEFDIADENIGDSFTSIINAGFVNNSLFIDTEVWHRPYNNGTENVVVIETWLGDSSEEDIERR